jgi:hypothetical protein
MKHFIGAVSFTPGGTKMKEPPENTAPLSRV